MVSRFCNFAFSWIKTCPPAINLLPPNCYTRSHSSFHSLSMRLWLAALMSDSCCRFSGSYQLFYNSPLFPSLLYLVVNSIWWRLRGHNVEWSITIMWSGNMTGRLWVLEAIYQYRAGLMQCFSFIWIQTVGHLNFPKEIVDWFCWLGSLSASTLDHREITGKTWCSGLDVANQETCTC